MYSESNESFSAGVTVLTLAVIMIIAMVGFHLLTQSVETPTREKTNHAMISLFGAAESAE